MPTTILALLLAPAVAQDGLDAHGFQLAPGDGDRLDYLSTWRSEAQRPGSFAVNGLFEYADSPLVLMTEKNGEVTRQVLVDNLVGLNVGATLGVHERVGVALAAPVWFASLGPEGAAGLGIGDIRLSVPVGLLLADEDEGGVGLSVIPFADLPTGSDARFLGNSGFGGGALVAGGYRSGGFDATANLGFQATPGIEYENLRGGGKLLGAVAVGAAVNEWLGLRAETVLRPSLSPNEVPGTESPGELILSARGRHEPGLSWTAGGATAVSKGASAAAFRVFAGIGWTMGKAPVPDTDGDGLTDDLDTCPTDPEVVNAFADTDGCPDALANLVVSVVNEDGQPVEGATVTLGGQTFTTTATGQLELADRMPTESVGGGATHPFYYEAKLDPVALAEGRNEAKIVLKYLPGKVRVITKSNGGAILDARVTLDGPAPMDPRNVGEDGQEVFELRPGDWRLLVSAEAFGTERRDVKINPGETSLVIIEVVLYPAKAEVKQTEIVILEKVNFDFDKDTILASSLPLLDQVSNVLLEHPEIKVVEVQGHTDDKGNDQYNLDLSQRRVESVRAYLIQKGVAPERLVAKGYGETQPIASNKTEKGRATNRRVQFIIVDPAPPAAAPAEPAPAPATPGTP
jgi:OOP family OmpA-OmpF porin